MHIGIDASRAFVADPTGTENYSLQLLKGLLRIDRKNRYIVYINPYRVNSRINLINLISNQTTMTKFQFNSLSIGNFLDQLGKLEIRNFEFKVIRWPKLWTQLGLALECLVNPPDVLFVPAHTLPVIRWPSLKTVVTIHDLGSEFLPEYHKFPQKIYLNWATVFAVKHATRIIAVSKNTKRDLTQKLHCKPEKIDVIYEAYKNSI